MAGRALNKAPRTDQVYAATESSAPLELDESCMLLRSASNPKGALLSFSIGIPIERWRRPERESRHQAGDAAEGRVGGSFFKL